MSVEHRLFHSSRKRQSQETGIYTVTASLEKARLQWLLGYIISQSPIKLEMLDQDLISSPGGKRGRTYHINKKYKNKYTEISIALHLRVSRSLRSLAN